MSPSSSRPKRSAQCRRAHPERHDGIITKSGNLWFNLFVRKDAADVMSKTVSSAQ
jgi:hypothetical protein